ncbi:MAG: maleylpyruvate isomerase family protein [Candidatus Microthrix parvicella]|uniref:maleylpyruvate isomerase N-terminal domain-containing protein n=1 Tax=Candidatus Neomicrothrix sp. TaxID=2719034 RepID=UPI0016B3B69A|nr:maleylpyruvate isomerase N-terminal domain-containing protein [Candidatus Microthrix sp.]MBL0203497.1 maleylpyruvate isomerase N-terminal domain-containing protein [Candidatus Microthrix sp.]NLH67990.1 maleylpyruvate isomerase family protein [Candidatus Microthrix parvicella]
MTEKNHEGSSASADEPVVQLLSAQFDAVVALANEIPDADWDRETDLPGWTVQDCFSHMIGVERQMLGLGEDSPPVAHLAHVDDDFSAMVEAPVELRRNHTPTQIRAELAETLANRRQALEELGPDGFDAESWTPAGPGTYRDFMLIRVFDLWMHEQDVRHGLDRPGHLAGPVVESVLRHNVAKALPMIVGKRAAAPAGATVVVNLTGPTEATFAVEVREVSGKKRASLADSTPHAPTTSIHIDVDTFMRLCGGRVDTEAAIGANPTAVSFVGDDVLGRAIVNTLSFTP